MTAVSDVPEVVQQATRAPALATEMPHGRTPGWWGMIMFVTTEATLFASLLGSYFYVRFQSGPVWPPPGIEKPELVKPLIMTALLLPSSLPVMWAERGIRKGQQWRLRLGLFITIVQGLGFLAVQATEYASNLKKFTFTTNAYGSLFYTITGFHGAHVLVGIVMLAMVLVRALRGHFGARRHEAVSNAALYWHFVDAVWLAVFTSLYVTPHLR
jgi:heme/copper-type cytochrome/quinol oxidase subunit 3